MRVRMTGEKGDEIERNAPSRWPKEPKLCPWDRDTARGVPPRVSSFLFVSFRVCFRLFFDIPREKERENKDRNRMEHFWTNLSQKERRGFENKQKKKKIWIDVANDRLQRASSSVLVPSIFGVRSKGELTNPLESIREFGGTKERNFSTRVSFFFFSFVNDGVRFESLESEAFAWMSKNRLLHWDQRELEEELKIRSRTKFQFD